MKTRPVFESYEEFVYSLTNAIYESENGNVDALNNFLGGLFKGTSDNTLAYQKKNLKAILDQLNNMVTKEAGEELTSFGENVSDYFKNSEKGIELGAFYLDRSDMFKYDWIIGGTCRVKGEPSLESDGSLGQIARETGDAKRISINTLLYSIFTYNMSVLDEMVNDSERTGKEKVWKQSNWGKKAKADYKYPFLTIKDPKDSEILEIVPFGEVPYNGSYEYGFYFPVFAMDGQPYQSKNKLGTSYFEDVIKPGGNDTEVTDKPYNSSGVDFFAENAVVIGEDGIASLKAILSEFNSIKTIKVNGGASSKTTSRAGGNEQLAKDRQAAGIKALQDLQKEGVEQLKGTKIEAGEAKVQSAAEESDPKNQQVSFIISGMIKNIEGADNKEVVIARTEDIFADGLKIRKSYIGATFNIS